MSNQRQTGSIRHPSPALPKSRNEGSGKITTGSESHASSPDFQTEIGTGPFTNQNPDFPSTTPGANAKVGDTSKTGVGVDYGIAGKKNEAGSGEGMTLAKEVEEGLK